MDLELRPATARDIDRIAELWEPAWRDGHLGGVPDGLVAIRDSADFRRRAALVQPHAIVAVVDDVVAGFVATNARARRFYERNGWTDGGAFIYLADTADGTFEVPCHRYVKRVGG